MPSDKCNLITPKAKDLISSLFNHFIPRHAFLSTAVAPMFASWFYQSLPLFSIPFSTTMKVTICGSAPTWFHGRLSNCSDCRSVYHAILLLKMVCKNVDNTENKA